MDDSWHKSDAPEYRGMVQEMKSDAGPREDAGDAHLSAVGPAPLTLTKHPPRRQEITSAGLHQDSRSRVR